MVLRTKKEITQWINDNWRNYFEKTDYPVIPDNIDVTVDKHKKEVEIELSSMYDSPGLTFKHLKALSEFFETDNISDTDRFRSSGCSSCDYGSKYGFTLRIW